MLCSSWTAVVALLLVGALVGAEAQQTGWRMVDRFYGFRYEVSGNAASEIADFPTRLQAQADVEGCFGWVQTLPSLGKFVGEARCSKERGVEFEKWIRENTGGKPLEVLVYPDTKIRLHFSHFKLVEAERDTCFLDEPHKCPDLEEERQPQQTSSGDEL